MSRQLTIAVLILATGPALGAYPDPDEQILRDAKIKRENIHGEEPAISAHAQVRREVRQRIEHLGNTMFDGGGSFALSLRRRNVIEDLAGSRSA